MADLLAHRGRKVECRTAVDGEVREPGRHPDECRDSEAQDRPDVPSDGPQQHDEGGRDQAGDEWIGPDGEAGTEARQPQVDRRGAVREPAEDEQAGGEREDDGREPEDVLTRTPEQPEGGEEPVGSRSHVGGHPRHRPQSDGAEQEDGNQRESGVDHREHPGLEPEERDEGCLDPRDEGAAVVAPPEDERQVPLGRPVGHEHPHGLITIGLAPGGPVHQHPKDQTGHQQRHEDRCPVHGSARTAPCMTVRARARHRCASRLVARGRCRLSDGRRHRHSIGSGLRPLAFYPGPAEVRSGVVGSGPDQLCDLPSTPCRPGRRRTGDRPGAQVHGNRPAMHRRPTAPTAAPTTGGSASFAARAAGYSPGGRPREGGANDDR